MTTIHTKECIAEDARIKQISNEWVAKWPNHCKECKGWGGSHSSYDPSPAGVSLRSGSIDEFDPCIFCAEKEICPRCGMTTLDRDAIDLGDPLHCGYCGWDSEDPDAMPPAARDYPCPCELAAERKAEKEWQREAEADYNSRIKVYCEVCKEWMPEKDVKFENIEEDYLGRDRMTFTCPKCNTVTKSLRVGR